MFTKENIIIAFWEIYREKSINKITIKELMDKFNKVLVAELNMGQFTEEVQRVSGRSNFDTLYKVNGRPLSPLEIIEKVKGM